MQNNDKMVLEVARPHTIKKFELIEEYVKAWSQKLLNFPQCEGIKFIDCMCNSGFYQDENGNEVVGTPIRVSNYLSEIMTNYPNKRCALFFNDLDSNKIEFLKTKLPSNANNFRIEAGVGEGNEFLKMLGKELPSQAKVHYLLVYDPYDASVDWEAILPFLRKWGEVIINHMVSDTVRGISQAKKGTVIDRYEQTYFAKIDELIGSNSKDYENRIMEIISVLKGQETRKYYTASFPFLSKTNTLIYNLIHCSGHIEGFKLFKKTAWKTFGGKSSIKKINTESVQLSLGIDSDIEIASDNDQYCYSISDIAKYLYDFFRGQEVAVETVWATLDEHPVFPSDGYRNDIKKLLKDVYNVKITKDKFIFNN